MPRRLKRKIRCWNCFVAIIGYVGVPFLVIGVVVVSIYTRQDLIAALGLALSIAVAYFAAIRPLLRKPCLDLFIDKVRCSRPTEQNDTASWFIRLGVVNYGLTPAKDCVGRVIEVWTEQGEQLMKFDPLTLFWARQDKDHTGFNPVTIQGSGDFEYLDVAQVKKKNSPPIELRVAIPQPMTLTRGDDDSPSPGPDPVLKGGTYYLLIGVHAVDASIRCSWFEITCTETVPASCGDIQPCSIRQKTPQFARR